MEPASFLPAHIVEVLKRKSSRDPSSRFCAKLHLLLSYASEDPANEERVGLGWINDQEFKMNKNILSSIMGIRLNTLNVNLRDLKFKQRQRDKDGWTHWSKSGFTRTSCGTPLETSGPGFMDKRYSRGYMDGTCIGKVPPSPFRLGKLTSQQSDQFFMECQRLWQDLMQVSPTSLVEPEYFVIQTAARFKHTEQPDNNAWQVINAIMRPSDPHQKLGYADFCRLLAMFGPAETLMLKIQSLLKCANETGNWLRFEQNMDHSLPYASFSVDMPNCLVVQRENNTIDRVYNDPNVTSNEKYVIDENMVRYDMWSDYFDQNPVSYSDMGVL